MYRWMYQTNNHLLLLKWHPDYEPSADYESTKEMVNQFEHFETLSPVANGVMIAPPADFFRDEAAIQPDDPRNLETAGFHLEASACTKTHLCLVARNWHNEKVYVAFVPWASLDPMFAEMESPSAPPMETKTIYRRRPLIFFTFDIKFNRSVYTPSWVEIRRERGETLNSVKPIFVYPAGGRSNSNNNNNN
jgi:hypothetical protein